MTGKRGDDVEQTNEAVYDGLARALAEAIRRFYADPANEAEFQEWLKQKKGTLGELGGNREFNKMILLD